ncbi:hypothetical protein CXF72_08655 [Psychromonas sp. MB-3u-54]|nr:hypothetical protein [Psychromonas sp. MB-3u-54]PKH02992.1 hypothetical protein CXF72_08655 [Psychromonas sp. MB-3u-54]
MIKIICDYDWPGNIGQLENIFQAMGVLNTGTQITSEMIIKSLSTTVVSPHLLSTKQLTKANVEEAVEKGTPLPISASEVLPLWKIEKMPTEAAIDFCAANVPKAAALLGGIPSTIYRKK